GANHFSLFNKWFAATGRRRHGKGLPEGEKIGARKHRRVTTERHAPVKSKSYSFSLRKHNSYARSCGLPHCELRKFISHTSNIVERSETDLRGQDVDPLRSVLNV